MKRALLALAVVAFVVAGAAQPAFAQQQQAQAENDSEMEEPETPENETEELENESEMENEKEMENRSNMSQGESAQFDARLKVAIDTVSALVDIAPSEEARNGLQNALESLRDVQNNTDTASLGPGERPERPDRGEEAENDSGESESQTGQQGPPENRGPSENSNRPGFVNRMLSGLFG